MLNSGYYFSELNLDLLNFKNTFLFARGDAVAISWQTAPESHVLVIRFESRQKYQPKY